MWISYLRSLKHTVSLNLVCFRTFRHHTTNSFPERLYLRVWSLGAPRKVLFVRCSTKSTRNTWKQIVPPNTRAAERRSAFFLSAVSYPTQNNFLNTIEHCDQILSKLIAKKNSQCYECTQSRPLFMLAIGDLLFPPALCWYFNLHCDESCLR